MPYANNRGIRIHYDLEGSGPPLMLQHGFSNGPKTFYESGYVKALKNNYQLILVEARGHGISDKPHTVKDYQADIVAGDYVAILDDLKIQKASYFGYSMGGRIGFQSLARYALPRLTSLIIGGATPYGTRTEPERKDYELRVAALRLAVEKGMAAYINAFFEKTYGSVPPERREQLLDNDPDALLANREAYEKWPSAEDILLGLNLPCLIFVGEADSRYPMAREGAKHIPLARFISFPGLNHLQAFSRSDLVLPHIKDFLATVNN